MLLFFCLFKTDYINLIFLVIFKRDVLVLSAETMTRIYEKPLLIVYTDQDTHLNYYTITIPFTITLNRYTIYQKVIILFHIKVIFHL